MKKVSDVGHEVIVNGRFLQSLLCSKNLRRAACKLSVLDYYAAVAPYLKQDGKPQVLCRQWTLL